MEPEFATEDIRSVFSKIMQFMDTKSNSSHSDRDLTPPKPKPKKLTSVRTQKPSAPVQPPSKKMQLRDFESGTYARMQARQQNVQEKIKRNAQLLQDEVQKNIKSKPDINKSSHKLQIKPISERYEDIIEGKNRKLTEMREKNKIELENKINKELTFQPNINKNSEKMFQAEGSEVMDRMKDWEEKKNLKFLMKKDEIEGKLKEELTFKPHLCENSVKMLSGCGEKKDVALRLFEHKKPEVAQEKFTFSPSLSMKTLKLTSNRSEAQVFSRLYTQKDSLSPEKDPVSD